VIKDEEMLLKRYRQIKKDCESFQADGWTIPACSFRAGNGVYTCCLKGDYVKEE
jgi:hypothetical protein